MLTFDNVRFQYDCEDFSIIDHLSFTVQDGEFVSVIGPSGCGKSTIFRLVNKLLPPAEGNILVNGQNINGLKNYCGYMPQQDMLFPWRTVKENVMLPMEIQGSISKAEMGERSLHGSFPAVCGSVQHLPELCSPDQIFCFWMNLSPPLII